MSALAQEHAEEKIYKAISLIEMKRSEIEMHTVKKQIFNYKPESSGIRASFLENGNEVLIK